MIEATVHIKGKQYSVTINSADLVGGNLAIDDVKDLLQRYIIDKTVSIIGDQIIDFGNVVYIKINDHIKVKGTEIPRL